MLAGFARSKPAAPPAGVTLAAADVLEVLARKGMAGLQLIEPGREALRGLGWRRVGTVLPPYPARGGVGWVVNAGRSWGAVAPVL